MLRELVDAERLKRRLREHCLSGLKDGCDCDLDECASCGVLKNMLEGAHVFMEELGIRTTFHVDPSDPKSECPFENFRRQEAWCLLEDGMLCHRTDCALKKLGPVLVRIG